MKKKFGIIGNPIKHSLSPVLHKYWFEKYDLDASYSIIEAKDKDKAASLFIKTQKLIDKMANKKVITKNSASRQKSRLNKNIKLIS